VSEAVYSVHATRPDDIGGVEVIFRTEREARDYAKDRSEDFRVVSTSVTRYLVGLLGTRHPVTWYADGSEQPQRFDRAGKRGRLYPDDGVRPPGPGGPPDQPRSPDQPARPEPRGDGRAHPPRPA
jgi:hypothetical protein